MREHRYAIERLFVDQKPDLVKFLIAPLISWLDPSGRGPQPVQFLLGKPVTDAFLLTWNMVALSKLHPGLEEELARYRARDFHRTQYQTEEAGYALALIAITCILKERADKFFVEVNQAPDIVLSGLPNKLRGVEVAGRSTRGHAGFKPVLATKRPHLLGMTVLVEAYLSLWCRQPPVSHWEKVKG